MPEQTLGGEELAALIERVFRPRPDERAMGVMIDLPDARVGDEPAWRARREMAAGWVAALAPFERELGLEVHLLLYRNAHMNNADLPPAAWLHPGGPLPARAEDLDPAAAIPFAEIFAAHPILMAPTHFSATAPLKLAAREQAIRAATMPGFSPAMVPALRLDYGVIHARCDHLKALLDRAEAAEIRFLSDAERRCELTLDLRHRSATASGGLFPEPGKAGNLPSGETYIVPYEGEREGDPSRSAGELPVQFGDELVFYRVEQNKAIEARGEGGAAREEAARLVAEPAYGNLAELGLGVLADFGIEPSGEILLDEKLGLHIAFGRSDHFGGQVGAAQFSSPDAVVHIDRVYIPRIQPRVAVERADLVMGGGERLALMRDNVYAIDFPA
ncbi:MAG: hypothetical protein JXR96_16675 [Deltaproteobacteria bacterium]|nr:hypothetical protein [Deltaproteobacteria bacterium]